MTENSVFSDDVLRDIRRALIDEYQTPEGKTMLAIAYKQGNQPLVRRLLSGRTTLPSCEELKTQFFCDLSQEIWNIVRIGYANDTSA